MSLSTTDLSADLAGRSRNLHANVVDQRADGSHANSRWAWVGRFEKTGELTRLFDFVFSPIGVRSVRVSMSCLLCPSLSVSCLSCLRPVCLHPSDWLKPAPQQRSSLWMVAVCGPPSQDWRVWVERHTCRAIATVSEGELLISHSPYDLFKCESARNTCWLSNILHTVKATGDVW